MSALQKAIDHFDSMTVLAERLGVKTQVVHNWKKRGVPVERCADIERATGGAVTRADLRPDHFGPIDAARAAA